MQQAALHEQEQQEQGEVSPQHKRKMRRQAYVLVVVALISAFLGAFLVASGALPNQYNLIPGQPAAGLITPGEDYEVTVFVSDLAAPRALASHPEQPVIFVTERGAGRVLALQDANQDRIADTPIVVAEGLGAPSGIVYHEGWLYIAEAGQVTRVELGPNYEALQREVIVQNLPAGRNPNETEGNLHALHIHDDELYLSVGASCATCEEDDSRRATVMVFALDGSNERVFARGLYQVLGMASNPHNGELWAANQGQPLLEIADAPESIYPLSNADDAGWPRCHGGEVVDPNRAGERGCDGALAPVLNLIPQGNVTDILFLPTQEQDSAGADSFSAYMGDLVAVLHGGVNGEGKQIGLGLIRFDIDPTTGQPTTREPYEFLGGFWMSEDPGDHIGRPFSAVLGADGVLYVSDDASGAIYQLHHNG